MEEKCEYSPAPFREGDLNWFLWLAQQAHIPLLQYHQHKAVLRSSAQEAPNSGSNLGAANASASSHQARSFSTASALISSPQHDQDGSSPTTQSSQPSR
ncbi:hypothetical protein CVT25_011480 [Psilocybe cyanescens]|uniref:Uncharacterized protein n=1 Tax=Psilocybe cyanescens TaxID=93625 RepID=A0A409XA89_PSICY|nr:hypothetical protein CVT25_011480 [Psilocybe cyanescens]